MHFICNLMQEGSLVYFFFTVNITDFSLDKGAGYR